MSICGRLDQLSLEMTRGGNWLIVREGSLWDEIKSRELSLVPSVHAPRLIVVINWTSVFHQGSDDHMAQFLHPVIFRQFCCGVMIKGNLAAGILCW